jgi:Fe-S-cluster containining protein
MAKSNGTLRPLLPIVGADAASKPGKSRRKAKKRKLYDCSRCPAYCCTYPRIAVEPRDISRLAARFEVTVEEATRRFTTAGEPGERVLRHKRDAIFGTSCRFLDARTRRCTVYEDRPSVCREYPDTPRCGYWEFLTFERRAQDDEGLTVSARVELSVAATEKLREGDAVEEAPPRARRERLVAKGRPRR